MNKSIGFIAAVLIMFTAFSVPFAGSKASAKSTNIALGKPYTIENGVSTEHSYANFTEDGLRYDVDKGYLTDGKYSSASSSATGYYKAFRGYSRLVTFDFGAVKRIDGFSASFFHANYGVYSPVFLKILLSDDGITFTECGSVKTLPNYSIQAIKRKYDFSFDAPYASRYVRIEFGVAVFVYCDEIEIYGDDNASGCLPVPTAVTETEKGVFPKFSPEMNGAGSIIKIYDGYFPTQSIADNTADELLPYIAYVNGDGAITDTMFDSVAFVPCHTDYPSGGRLVKTSNKPGAVLSDWELYISRTFAEGLNLDALESAAKRMNEALKDKSLKKIKVFLTIPYPMKQDKQFGDINGDGRAEYTRTYGERLSVAEWYISEVTQKFAEKNYSYLELSGFYWYCEGVVNGDSDCEDKLIRGIKDYIDEEHGGLCLLFDPFYLSEGFDKWSEYGFDGAVMQPNLIFRDYFTADMLDDFCDQIKRFNLGVEIETAEPRGFESNADARKNGAVYENYLYYLWKNGCMNALQTFYQGAGPGTINSFKESDDPYLNYLYDITYKFVKGTYSMSAPTVSADNQTVECDSKRNRMPMTVTGDCYFADITVKASALHGDVTPLANKAALMYTPEKGFSGNDAITVTVTDKFGGTNSITLEVAVQSAESAEPSSAESSHEASSEAEISESGSNESGNNGSSGKALPWIIAGCVAALLVAVGLFVVIKRRGR